MASLKESLEATLKSASTERLVQRWLEVNPLVLAASLPGVVYANKVVSQFKFGTDFVADFVAFGAYSGACCVHFVELEPPGEKLFTQKGSPARRLNEALSQIADWKVYVEKHRHEVLLELSKVFRKRELVYGRKDWELTDTTGMAVYDPDQWINWYYHIVIGRQERLEGRELSKKTAFLAHSEVDVMTYDRLLAQATLLEDNTVIPPYRRRFD